MTSTATTKTLNSLTHLIKYANKSEFDRLLEKEYEQKILIGGGDAIEWLENRKSSSVDLLITDVPYESLEKWRKIGTTTRLKNWFELLPYSRFDDLFSQMYRVMKKNTHLYFFSDWDTLKHAEEAGRKAGFTVWAPIIWSKVSIGLGYHYRNTYEFIMFFEKGKRKLNSLGIPNFLEVPPMEEPEFTDPEVEKILGVTIKERKERSIYPTVKPVNLMKTLIRQSSEPGDVICDPFMGTGPTGFAALDLDRKFWGNDLSMEMVELVEKELESRIKMKLKTKLRTKTIDIAAKKAKKSE